MAPTPPPVHVPRPYALPQTALAARVEVPTDDGATIVVWTYAPAGVSDEPGTPYGVDLAVPPVLMLHGNGEEQAEDAAVGEAEHVDLGHTEARADLAGVGGHELVG